MFHSIPDQRPNTPLLDQIDQPEQLRQLTPAQLPQLAEELRAYLLYSVGQSGGHFGAGLGVIELTIALHFLLQTPDDHLVWDVGHQCYPHKILTGRREALTRIRKSDGPSPFPKRDESPFDSFGVGHSSTSISAALGMALADRQLGRNNKTVAVIGDGAMTAGMAFEALNHAAHTHANMLVILNDNDMSISRNEGGLATYLAKNLKNQTAGDTTAALFEALDFEYSGPVDGHDFEVLLPVLAAALNRTGPQFLHIITRKGKGFAPAEADPVGYHSLTKIEPIRGRKQPKKPSFSNIFGRWICATAETDPTLCAITPAMREGSDLVAFSEQFSDRYFDVAIAEQHALTLAAGMACEGLKPVVAIYSTFLQRAYDQLIHDASLQKLDLLLAIDRAGLVGEDGATHAGCFDLAMLRCLPDAVIMTPADGDELNAMLTLGHNTPGIAAVRYPRGAVPEPLSADTAPLVLGQARLIRQGREVALLNFGPLLQTAAQVAEQFNYTLVDMRFVKPLDESMIRSLAEQHNLLVTLEDHAVMGGAGEAVSACLHRENLNVDLLSLGIPDRWISHASRAEQLQACGLDPQGISAAIQVRLK
ncbi:1-deoxy-D-xylulose-5-phosphate synthase [Neptuniibacter sp. CAU 1671]|uniref:1-deoxy-D-xylulose-5-phosphate synthase n=1 Tax=Neptuniibacter sp. CAU 1671 TaxID=3032593 RepID=UPI0023DC6F88|nr:1-deoxy-D-xylulose-5-phosphate synthase [Neptuniibacter sp. CAU 1671]MDF2181683.1 1-deoxy-D-xylulose-5-phosphate synthase [Neptuniibacter sp. CAU 1671]